MAQDLVKFALSHEGQEVVRAAGYVDLNVGVADWDPCTGSCPPRYAAMVKKARRLTLDFRFRSGTFDLDSRSADVDRLVRFVRDRQERVALVGFSDTGASSAEALKDSQACAHAVATLLQERGVSASTVDGFGDAMPIASKSDEKAHYRNRRVEVWTTASGPPH